jgi:uncharacterized protein (DUF305 family)
MIRPTLLVLAAAASTVCTWGSQAEGDPSLQIASVNAKAARRPPSKMGAVLGRDTADPDLVLSGQYDDVRFLDMMAAHHQMAVEQAKMALERADHEELRAMAHDIIDTQTAQIEEIRSIRLAEYGSAHVPLVMNRHQTDNMGTVTDAQLVVASPFDLAFIDGMMPHHAGAITMASVARLRSNDPQILTMARTIIDAQTAEIGKMIEMRKAWYPAAP